MNHCFVDDDDLFSSSSIPCAASLDTLTYDPILNQFTYDYDASDSIFFHKLQLTNKLKSYYHIVSPFNNPTFRINQIKSQSINDSFFHPMSNDHENDILISSAIRNCIRQPTEEEQKQEDPIEVLLYLYKQLLQMWKEEAQWYP